MKMLLTRGCKFTPIPKRNLNDINFATTNFCRKLRLTEYFLDTRNEDNNIQSIAQNPSSFDPPKGRDENLEILY